MENNGRVGQIHKTREWGDLIIINYNGNRDVSVRFLSTGYETKTSYSSIILGSVRDRLLPSVYGVGIVGSKPISKDSKKLKEYELWCSMLLRCYDEKKHLANPTYKGCTVSDNFKYFPYFKDWCNKQVGFNQEGWHLDKDILVKGNKVYSEDTCCFVPPQVNVLFVKCDGSRGSTLIGVHHLKLNGKYSASLNKQTKQISLGKFNTEEEAFFAYKTAKELHIKDIAEKYKDVVSDKVHNALINYSVDFDD